jgi:hypothetical protein
MRSAAIADMGKRARQAGFHPARRIRIRTMP